MSILRLSINIEERFLQTPGGEIWSNGCFVYPFWKRYLDVFEEVKVIARVGYVASLPSGSWKRADGDRVDFHPLPYYLGPQQYARRLLSIRSSLRTAIDADDAIILRVSSPIAQYMQKRLSPKRPFALEVIGNVRDIFAPGAIKHPLRAFLRTYFTRQLKAQCRTASAVAYVTDILRREYPTARDAFSTVYSNVELDDSGFAMQPRQFGQPRSPVRIVSVGTLEVLYKGFDVLIDAVTSCVQGGLNLTLTLVGDGRCRAMLESRAQARGLGNRVTFTGRLPGGDAVRRELDAADLFVLASKTEGLPRAMIEAMARGLPCIGSDVGGIPELLANENRVPRGDVTALARKVSEVIRNPARMTRMAQENLLKSREYHSSILAPRRRAFYLHVRRVTERWKQQLRIDLTKPRTPVC